MSVPYTLFVAGNEFVPRLTKNTPSEDVFLGQTENELVPSQVRGTRDNHYEARSFLVRSSFPA
jgi:hypothetical protein